MPTGSAAEKSFANKDLDGYTRPKSLNPLRMAWFDAKMVLMTTSGPSNGRRRTQTPPITQELIAATRQLVASTPASPRRLLVEALVRMCRQETGGYWGRDWYQKVLEQAGVHYAASTRTYGKVLADLKETDGVSHGVTLKAIAQLERLVRRIEVATLEIKDQAERVAVAHEAMLQTMARQQAIGDALQKRQLMFADQSQTYGRLFEELTKAMSTGLSKFIATAERIDGSHLQATIQANRVSGAAERLLAKLNEREAGSG